MPVRKVKTDQEINEEIARFLGYEKTPEGAWEDPDGAIWINVPDYWNDMDASCDIYEYLPLDRQMHYIQLLMEVVYGGEIPEHFQLDPSEMIFAPAQCRAEAMLELIKIYK